MTIVNKINVKHAAPVDLQEQDLQPVLASMKLLQVEANVGVVFDDSTSMEHEYEEGHVQQMAARNLALALAWDPDKKADVFALNKGPYIGTMELNSFDGFIGRNIQANGNTRFAPALRAVIKHYTPPQPRSSLPVWLRNALFGAPEPAKQAIPAFVVFYTDGEVQDEDETRQVLRELAGTNIFVQFVGMGETPCTFLENLTYAAGSGARNVGFFKMPCEDDNAVVCDAWLYQQLTEPFSEWLRNRA